MSSKSQRAANRTLISFFSRNKYHILICLLATAGMVFLFLLEITPVRYDLQIGMVPNQTIAATKGRASYLGERSIGHQDPGATSSLYMLEEMVKCL